MTETEFLNRFRIEKEMFRHYGNHLATLIREAIIHDLKIDGETFFKVPIVSRVKGEDSIIQKAFYRNKNYQDPYSDITDKVGARVVVLLEEQANSICKVIESLADYSFSKDRDFEFERSQNPELFDYKSHHYILRNKQDLSLATDVNVPEGTPFEIQIRTLLQHAYAELTHDTIYKPNTVTTPDVKRSVAKCMALIEVTDQLFSQVDEKLKRLENQFSTIVEDTASLLLEGTELSINRDLCDYILDSYLSEIETYSFSSLKKFVSEYSFVLDKIKEKSRVKYLYRQPIILFLYMLVQSKRKLTKSKWPLATWDLEEIFTDLGYSFDRS